MKTPENFQELNQRSLSPVAWLDEVVMALKLAMKDAYNAETVEEKNKVILATTTYLRGIGNGNRFMRENPYKDSAPLPINLQKDILY